MDRVLFVIMAGGRGERLRPLTCERPKPLVRFGTNGRIIDFTLYNCLASGCKEVLVLTQYLSEMVEGYLRLTWRKAFTENECRLDVLPGINSFKGLFLGTADAVYQALVKRDDLPDHVAVLAGDHVYRMNYRRMIEYHRSHGKAATIAAVKCNRKEAHRFGIIKDKDNGKIEGFFEKPGRLSHIVAKGRKPIASMGIYVFTTSVLMRYLEQNQKMGSHDFGKDVVPLMAEQGKARIYNFMRPNGKSGYWRDVGDVYNYWKANMEILNGKRSDLNFDAIPGFTRKPISEIHFIKNYERGQRRIYNSMVSDKAHIGKALIEESIIGPEVKVEDGAVIKRSVILDGVKIRQRADLDGVVVEPYSEVTLRGDDLPNNRAASKEIMMTAGSDRLTPCGSHLWASSVYLYENSKGPA